MAANENEGPKISVTTRSDGIIYIDMGSVTRFLGLTPDQAGELGLMLIQQAAVADYVMAAAAAKGQDEDQH